MTASRAQLPPDVTPAPTDLICISRRPLPLPPDVTPASGARPGRAPRIASARRACPFRRTGGPRAGASAPRRPPHWLPSRHAVAVVIVPPANRWQRGRLGVGTEDGSQMNLFRPLSHRLSRPSTTTTRDHHHQQHHHPPPLTHTLYYYHHQGAMVATAVPCTDHHRVFFSLSLFPPTPLDHRRTTIVQLPPGTTGTLGTIYLPPGPAGTTNAVHLPPPPSRTPNIPKTLYFFPPRPSGRRAPIC